MNHFAHWKANVWKVPKERERWYKDKFKAVLEFARNLIAGLSLYVLSLAAIPYTSCGASAWREGVGLALNVAGALIVVSAYANWSLSFSWPALRRISFYFGMVLAAASYYTVVDYKLWSDDLASSRPRVCTGMTLWGVGNQWLHDSSQ